MASQLESASSADEPLGAATTTSLLVHMLSTALALYGCAIDAFSTGTSIRFGRLTLALSGLVLVALVLRMHDVVLGIVSCVAVGGGMTGCVTAAVGSDDAVPEAVGGAVDAWLTAQWRALALTVYVLQYIESWRCHAKVGVLQPLLMMLVGPLGIAVSLGLSLIGCANAPHIVTSLSRSVPPSRILLCCVVAGLVWTAWQPIHLEGPLGVGRGSVYALFCVVAVMPWGVRAGRTWQENRDAKGQGTTVNDQNSKHHRVWMVALYGVLAGASAMQWLTHVGPVAVALGAHVSQPPQPSPSRWLQGHTMLQMTSDLIVSGCMLLACVWSEAVDADKLRPTCTAGPRRYRNHVGALTFIAGPSVALPLYLMLREAWYLADVHDDGSENDRDPFDSFSGANQAPPFRRRRSSGESDNMTAFKPLDSRNVPSANFALESFLTPPQESLVPLRRRRSSGSASSDVLTFSSPRTSRRTSEQLLQQQREHEQQKTKPQSTAHEQLDRSNLDDVSQQNPHAPEQGTQRSPPLSPQQQLSPDDWGSLQSSVLSGNSDSFE